MRFVTASFNANPIAKPERPSPAINGVMSTPTVPNAIRTPKIIEPNFATLAKRW